MTSGQYFQSCIFLVPLAQTVIDWKTLRGQSSFKSSTILGWWPTTRRLCFRRYCFSNLEVKLKFLAIKQWVYNYWSANRHLQCKWLLNHPGPGLCTRTQKKAHVRWMGIVIQGHMCNLRSIYVYFSMCFTP